MISSPHRDRLIETAQAAGILSTDALGPVIAALADVTAELERARAEIKADRAAVPLSDQHVETISRRLMTGCQAWSRRFLWASYLRSGALLAGTLLLTLGVGISVGWMLRAPAQGMVCGEQPNGAVMCYFYQSIPKQRVQR